MNLSDYANTAVGGSANNGAITINSILTKKQSVLTELFQGDTQKYEKFRSNVVRLFTTGQNLSKCDPLTVLGSAMQAAYLNLDLDPNLGQAYVIARYNKNLYGQGQGGYEATYQTGYQGLIELVTRTGQIKSIRPMIVYENEPFDLRYTINGEVFDHQPLPPSKRGEKKIGAYVLISFLNGGNHLEFMWAEDILAIKELSSSKDSNYSPWNSNLISQEAMWKKTVLRRACKYIPKSTTVANVLKIEDTYDEYGNVNFAKVVEGEDPIINDDENGTTLNNTNSQDNMKSEQDNQRNKQTPAQDSKTTSKESNDNKTSTNKPQQTQQNVTKKTNDATPFDEVKQTNIDAQAPIDVETTSQNTGTTVVQNTWTEPEVVIEEDVCTGWNEPTNQDEINTIDENVAVEVTFTGNTNQAINTTPVTVVSNGNQIDAFSITNTGVTKTVNNEDKLF